MHGRYRDDEAAAQAAALADDMHWREVSDNLREAMRVKDSAKPAPPAGHASRRHYESATKRFEAGDWPEESYMDRLGRLIAKMAQPLQSVTFVPAQPLADMQAAKHDDVLDAVAHAPYVAKLAAQLADSGAAQAGAGLIGYSATVAPASQGESLRPVRHGNRWCVPQPPGSRYDVLLFPCDDDGWIPHRPGPDRPCPVPAGVAFEILCGRVLAGPFCPGSGEYRVLWGTGSCVDAWRPVAKGA